jgi:hypothetical protein
VRTHASDLNPCPDPIKIDHVNSVENQLKFFSIHG